MPYTTLALGTAGQVYSAAAHNQIVNNLNAFGPAAFNIKSTTKTDRFTYNATTAFVDVTGLSVSITPSSSSSLVLVVATMVVGNTSSADIVRLNLVRGSTNIAQSTGSSTGEQTGVIYTASATAGVGITLMHLDNPATTSATTYKVQVARLGGTAVIGGFASNNSYSAVSTITAIEVPV